MFDGRLGRLELLASGSGIGRLCDDSPQVLMQRFQDVQDLRPTLGLSDATHLRSKAR